MKMPNEITRFLHRSIYKVLGARYSALQSPTTEDNEVWKQGLYPPGHFHSPIVSGSSLKDQAEIDYSADIPGVKLNIESQFALLVQLNSLYAANIFSDNKIRGSRYYLKNDYFSYSDGIFLNLVMRYFKPKHIIEVGSGFSSAAMLDTNEKFLHNEVKLSFIEPYPEERLNKLKFGNDECTVYQAFVQHLGTGTFSSLSSNDILFIDSSHVSKYKSDLNYILFEVLPCLKPGVIVHFHDIFFPFEYPIEWLRQGRSWNEAYMLRAFLQYNDSFEIILFTSFLQGKFRSWFEMNMPLCLSFHEYIQLGQEIHLMKTTGQSLYLRKL